jgi:hypothetical protein
MENDSRSINSHNMEYAYDAAGAYTFKSVLGKPSPFRPVTVCETHSVTNPSGVVHTQAVEFITYRSADNP